MTDLTHLLSKPYLSEHEAQMCRIKLESLLIEAQAYAEASKSNTQFRADEMSDVLASITTAIDELPSVDGWEEEVAIERHLEAAE